MTEQTRKHLRVEYCDGNTETLNPNRPKLLVAFETEFGVQQPETHQQVCWLAWHGLGRPYGTLDAWLDHVEAVEPTDVPVGKADSSATSPPSP